MLLGMRQLLAGFGKQGVLLLQVFDGVRNVAFEDMVLAISLPQRQQRFERRSNLHDATAGRTSRRTALHPGYPLAAAYESSSRTTAASTRAPGASSAIRSAKFHAFSQSTRPFWRSGTRRCFSFHRTGGPATSTLSAANTGTGCPQPK